MISSHRILRRELLRNSADCIEALEDKFEATLTQPSMLGLSSKALPLLEQRAAICNILRQFNEQLLDALRTFELKALRCRIQSERLLTSKKSFHTPVNDEVSKMALSLFNNEKKIANRNLANEWKQIVTAHDPAVQQFISSMESISAETDSRLRLQERSRETISSRLPVESIPFEESVSLQQLWKEPPRVMILQQRDEQAEIAK